MVNAYSTEIIAQVFALGISVFSLWKRSVTVSGFLSMLLISAVFIWNQGMVFLILLFAMYASASLWTRYRHAYKSTLLEPVVKKHGPRDAVQALCNLGVAFFCFLFYLHTREQVYLLALMGSVASSNADSWASELGVLSKQKPVLITTFKPCPVGISGGITWLGTFAGIAGSFFIAGLAWLLAVSTLNSFSGIVLFLIIS